MAHSNASSPRVSIILPVYNGAAFLAESVESCLAQSFDDLELVIVDDGSTDETAAVVAAFTDPRIRGVRHEVNKGLPEALNTGFALARGELLTWTSDDNRFRRRALQQMVSALDAHSGVGLVYADHFRVDPQGRPIGRWCAGEPRHLVRFNAIGPCFMFRRAVWSRVGHFDATVLLAEDYDFWIRAWKEGFRFLHVDEVLYDYRLHTASLGERAGSVRVSQVQRRVRERHFRPWRLWLDQVAARFSRVWYRLFDGRWLARERQIGRTSPLEDASTSRPDLATPPRPLTNRIRQAIRDPYYGLLRRGAGCLPQGRGVILLYHSVSDSNSPLSVGVEQFERQLVYLRRHFDIVSLTELNKWRAGLPGPRRARPLAALTFDDGFLDGYEVVRPILLRLGLPATFYVTISLVGSYSPPTWGPPLPMMTWSHLETMQSEGFDIGAHTLTHPDLTRLETAGMDHELRASKDILEARLACPVTTFAYPAGLHDAAVVARVREAGFDMAVTTVRGSIQPGNAPLTLRRVGIGRFVRQAHFEALLSRAVDVPLLMWL